MMFPAHLRHTFAGLCIALAFIMFAANSNGLTGADYSRIREVTPGQATQLIDGGAVVVDVRGTEAYGHRHIPGAVSIPLDQLQQGIAALAIARDRLIVVYCGDGIGHGPEGTALLNKAGYANAVNLKGGIDIWQSEKMPLAQG